MKEREIDSIVDAPEISLSEGEKAGEVLQKFYVALGWNKETEILDPCKVRTTKRIFDGLYDLMFEKYPDYVTVGMVMVSRGPGVDDDIPDGKVYLLKDWIEPVNKSIKGIELGTM